VAAVVTDPVKHEKAAVIDPKLVPLAAALDPLIMKGMPKPITAATGMDALTHAIEAYINRWPHPETPALCVSAVRLIFANLPRAYENGDDLEAREAMALASLYAGLAFTKAYVGYVHAFSHKLGGTYGVPHGLCNAIVLPFVLDFVQDSDYARSRLAELALAIGAGTEGESPEVLAQRFIDRVRALNAMLGVPKEIAALQASDLNKVARAAMIEASRDYPVPKGMTLGEAEAVLRQMLPTESPAAA
jgi:alcohol dehydrogenase class IV